MTVGFIDGLPKRSRRVAMKLLSLVTEEFLIEGHESADTAVTTTMCFVRLLICLLLGMLE